MKKITLFLFLLLSINVCAKKYQWKGLDHEYNITLVRSMGRDAQLLKVFAVGKNADAAIEQALQDAVAAAIFTGYMTKLHDDQKEALWAGFSSEKSADDFYKSHKEYFDNFFKSGEFLKYAKNVNTAYPSGENNIATPEGRKVGLNVSLAHDSLRERLETDGILKKLSN